MMGRTGYTVLGWIVWKVGSRVIRRRLSENRVKLGAAAAAVTVVALGIGVAAATAGDDEG